MTAAKILNVIEWVLYGAWNAANVAVVAMLRWSGIIISPQREAISWFTSEVVNVLTGISVIIAIAVGIKKLFFDKPKERKFNKKYRNESKNR